MKIPQNTGKKREKKYFGISRFSLERVLGNLLRMRVISLRGRLEIACLKNRIINIDYEVFIRPIDL